MSVDSEMPFVNEKGNGCQSREIIDGAVASRKRLPKPVSIKDPINNYGNELKKNEIERRAGSKTDPVGYGGWINHARLRSIYSNYLSKSTWSIHLSKMRD